jgi:hemin uptake protein HemP
MNRTGYRTSEIARHPVVEPSAPDDGLAIEPTLVRRVESVALFERGREVIILHHGQEYRLRITKLDKLILTK